MWQIVCTVGTLHAYMTYKRILKIFNQHEKIAASTFILNYDFLKEKILTEMNKKNLYESHFFSFLGNQTQYKVWKKISIPLFCGGFIFQLKWLGFIFIQIQSPLSLSLENTENQTKREEPKNRSKT